MSRKIGDPVFVSDNKKIINNMKKSVRTLTVTSNRIKDKLGDECKYISEYFIGRLSEIIIELNEENIAGIQKRISHILDEIKNKLD